MGTPEGSPDPNETRRPTEDFVEFLEETLEQAERLKQAGEAEIEAELGPRRETLRYESYLGHLPYLLHVQLLEGSYAESSISERIPYKTGLKRFVTTDFRDIHIDHLGERLPGPVVKTVFCDVSRLPHIWVTVWGSNMQIEKLTPLVD